MRAGKQDPGLSGIGPVSAVERLEVRKRARALEPYLEYVPLSKSKLGPYRDAEAKLAVESFAHTIFPEDKWSNGEDLIQAFSLVQGLVIEVGGPSPNYSIVDLADIANATGKKIQITNVKPEELRHPIAEEITSAVEVAGILDARHMNLPSHSVGAILASGLPYTIMKRFLSESHRVIEPSGLLVLRAAGNLDIVSAIIQGFDVINYQRSRLTWDDGFHEDLWEVALRRSVQKSRELKIGKLSVEVGTKY